MLIAVLADEKLKPELLNRKSKPGVGFVWADSVSSLLMIEADCYFDLKFEMDAERTRKLRSLLSKPVFIGAVNDSLNSVGDERFIRINSWPGMIERETLELAFSESQSSTVAAIQDQLGWSYISVPDVAGMVTPRIISMIINEAYFALGEGLSTRAEIDIAMKSGTSYPYGPFEWCAKIGTGNILALLRSLQSQNPGRYEIAPTLIGEYEGTEVVAQDDSGRMNNIIEPNSL
ncbi:3-hydroxyacyl-CoA dehydrogenase family protein [Flavitalea antarctica]